MTAKPEPIQAVLRRVAVSIRRCDHDPRYTVVSAKNKPHCVLCDAEEIEQLKARLDEIERRVIGGAL